MKMISKDEAIKMIEQVKTEKECEYIEDCVDWIAEKVVEKVGLAHVDYAETGIAEILIDTTENFGYIEEKDAETAAADAIELAISTFYIYLRGFGISEKDLNQRDICFVAEEVLRALKTKTGTIFEDQYNF